MSLAKKDADKEEEKGMQEASLSNAIEYVKKYSIRNRTPDGRYTYFSLWTSPKTLG